MESHLDKQIHKLPAQVGWTRRVKERDQLQAAPAGHHCLYDRLIVWIVFSSFGSSPFFTVMVTDPLYPASLE